MEHYVYLKSTDSNNMFPDNRVFKFRIHLKNPLILNGFWKVGLCEFYVKKQLNKPKAKIQTDIVLDLYSNICKESMVNGEEQPLLRRIQQNNSDGWSYIFDPVIYIPVKRRSINL